MFSTGGHVMSWHAKTKRDDLKLNHNVTRDNSPALKHLRCGHTTNRQPLVTGRRSMYMCPTCGDLVEARGR